MVPDLVTRVRQQKALARRNQAVRNGVLFVGVVIGLMVAIGWIWLAPDADPVPMSRLLVGVGAGVLLGWLALFVGERALFPRRAACPTCGHCWEIKEGRVPPMEKMPNWDRCPGCGTLMNEVLLAGRS